MDFYTNALEHEVWKIVTCLIVCFCLNSCAPVKRVINGIGGNLHWLLNLYSFSKYNSKILLSHPIKGLVNLRKLFYKLLLIEKPLMRKTECQKPHKKFEIATNYEGFKI